jgi:hypothetical protein
MKNSTSWLASLLLLGAVASWASQFESFDRAAQVAGSELILAGRVVSTRSEWTSDHSAIVTFADIAIDEVWKGTPPGDRVTVSTLGGSVDDVTLEVDGAATFTEGERVVVFLHEEAGRLAPWGMRFGKFSIEGEGEDAFVIGSLPPTVSGAQRYVQVSIPLAELRAEVEALVEKEAEQ